MVNRVHTPWGTTKTGTRAGFTPRPRFKSLHAACAGAQQAKDARSTTPLQASLFSAQPSATALGLLRPVEGTTVAAAVVASTAIEIATTRVAAAITVRRRTAEITALAGRPWPVFRDIEPQITPADFTTVKLFDGLRGVLFCCEPDECEPPGAAGLAVLWNVNVNDLADFSEELTQLLVGRGKVEVPYEYLA